MGGNKVTITELKSSFESAIPSSPVLPRLGGVDLSEERVERPHLYASTLDQHVIQV